MNKTAKIVIWIVVIALVIWGVSSFRKEEQKTARTGPVKVGLAMPLSGELATFGTNVKEGIEIAFAQKGISTSSVELIYEDTGAFTTSAAFTAFKKLVEVDKVDVVIGPFGPAQTLTVAPTIASTTITVISVSNCDDRFKEYPRLFCIYPGISDQIVHAVDFMKLRNWKNVYLLTENTEFGILIEDLLKSKAGEVNLLGSEKVVPNQTKDFRTIIAKAVAAKPDVVFAMFAPNEGFVVLKQFPPLAKNIPLYIGTDINKDQLKDIFGQEAKGIYFASQMSEEYHPDFIQRFKDVAGHDPDYFAALGHSSATILLDGLEKVGGDISELAGRLVGLTDESTAVTGFRFKEDRTIDVPLYSYQFKDGKFIPYQP